MSLDTIHLRKALKFCMLDDDRAYSALRREAYEDRRRVAFPSEGGGDYYGPFWSDAKSFAIEGTDLATATSSRIESNGRRSRLYPILSARFSDWWHRFESGVNEPLTALTESVHNRHDFDDLGITVKVDNLLAFQIDRERHRLIYPYFSETPTLTERWARVGLWAMTETLETYRLADMVILDVQRARSFSVREVDLRGDEESIFTERMTELRVLWDSILDEAA